MISDFREGGGEGFQKSESPYIKKGLYYRRKIGDRGEGGQKWPKNIGYYLMMAPFSKCCCFYSLFVKAKVGTGFSINGFETHLVSKFCQSNPRLYMFCNTDLLLYVGLNWTHCNATPVKIDRGKVVLLRYEKKN